MRGVLAVDEHRIASDDPFFAAPLGRAGVRVDVKVRKIARRYVDPNSVPALEQV